jgi:tetratricopeptide (TPR) repeat protein
MKKIIVVAIFGIACVAAIAQAGAKGLVISTPEFASLMTPTELSHLKSEITRLYPEALDDVVRITGDESLRKSFKTFYISIYDTHPYETEVRGFNPIYGTGIRTRAQGITIHGQAILTGKMDLKTLMVHEMLHAALDTRYSFDDYRNTPHELREGIVYFTTGEAHMRFVDDLNDIPEEFDYKAIWADAWRRDYHRSRQGMRCFEKIYGKAAFDKFVNVLFSGRGYKKALKVAVDEDYKTVKKKCDNCIKEMLKQTLLTSMPIQQVIKAFDDRDYRWTIELAGRILKDKSYADWTILAHWHTAQAYQKLYRFDEAIKHYELLRMGKVGPNHFHEVAAFQIIYCLLLASDCEKAAAKRVEFQRWYPEIWRDYMEDLDEGFAHECVAGAGRFNRAFFHFHKKDWPAAASELRQALALYLADKNADAADIAETRYTLGVVLAKMGNYSEAIPLYVEALEYEKVSEGPDSGGVFLNVAKLAAAHEALGQPDAAEKDWLDYIDYLKAALRVDDRFIARAKKSLGDLYFKLGRRDDAFVLFAEALAIYDGVLPGNDLWVAQARQSLGRALSEAGRYDEALPNLELALQVGREVFPEISPKTARTLRHLAECYQAMGRGDEALKAARESLDILSGYPWAEKNDMSAAQSLVERLAP